MITREDPEQPINLSRNSKSVSEVVDEVVASEPGKKKMIASERLFLLVILKSSPIVILAISCVIAVFVDPLFFYLPIIDEKNKCIGMDTNLRNVVLILRSLTDIGFIGHSIHTIHEGVRETRNFLVNLPEIEKGKAGGKPNRDERSKFAKTLARKLSWHSIVIDFFALLPIPQVVILAFRSSRYLDQRKIPNFFLLAQYLPRVYRLRHSSKKFKHKTGMWAKGLFYFFLYLLASHVLGAFWYYFSIQQETACWYRACKKHSTRGCIFYCDENMTSRNTTFIDSLDEFCLIDVPTNETAPFDFGIFLDSLKNGNTGSIHFAKKFFYSFWWGLRNLSNFGTNMETSTYVWENCFAILISVIGLVLFLYLIGKVQTFISMKTEKSEERMKKLSLKEIEVQMWMGRNNLKIEMKKEIKKNMKLLKWEEIRDANMDNMFSIFSMQPPKTRKSLKKILCMETLKKVPMLENIDEKVLTAICEVLKPVIYQDNSFAFRMGEPLDRMLFITDGLIWTYHKTSGGGSTSQDDSGKNGSEYLAKGDFYGDELLSWAYKLISNNDHSFKNVPMSNTNVKCHAQVEGFVLMAKDLKDIIAKYKFSWDLNNASQRRETASSKLQRAIRHYLVQNKSRNDTGESHSFGEGRISPNLEEGRPKRTTLSRVLNKCSSRSL